MIVFHRAMGRNEETTQKLVIKSNYDESKKFPRGFTIERVIVSYVMLFFEIIFS